MTFQDRTVDKCACPGGGLSYCEEEWQGVDEGQTGQEITGQPALLIPSKTSPDQNVIHAGLSWICSRD